MLRRPRRVPRPGLLCECAFVGPRTLTPCARDDALAAQHRSMGPWSCYPAASAVFQPFDPNILCSGCYVGSPAPFHVALVPLSSVVRRISAFRPEHPALGMTRWQPSFVPCSPGPAVQRHPPYFSLSARTSCARDVTLAALHRSMGPQSCYPVSPDVFQPFAPSAGREG